MWGDLRRRAQTGILKPAREMLPLQRLPYYFIQKLQRYLLEKEILVLKVKEHLTFREAKIDVSQMYVSPGVSFASTAKKSPQHADITPSMVTVNKPIAQNSSELELPGRPM